MLPFDDVGADDRVKFTVVPQLRIGLTRGGHVVLNLGVELPPSDPPYDWRGLCCCTPGPVSRTIPYNNFIGKAATMVRLQGTHRV